MLRKCDPGPLLLQLAGDEGFSQIGLGRGWAILNLVLQLLEAPREGAIPLQPPSEGFCPCKRGNDQVFHLFANDMAVTKDCFNKSFWFSVFSSVSWVVFLLRQPK